MDIPAAGEPLKLSVKLFSLLTEAVRLRSDAVLRLITVDQLLADLLAPDLVEQSIDSTSLADHLEAQPAAGPVVVEIALSGEGDLGFAAWRRRVSAALSRPASNEESVSALLFLYVVECEVQAALKALDRQAPRSVGRLEVAEPRGIVLPFPDRGR